MQAMRRADRPDVLFGKQRPTLYVLDNEERPPKVQTVGFSLSGPKLGRPQSLLGRSHRIDHGFELIRLEREGAVWAAIGPTQAEMLFENARS